MNKIEIYKEDYELIYKVIKDNIYKCIAEKNEYVDTTFHHRSDMMNLISLIDNGILSKERYVKKVENREMTEKEIFIFSDNGHVNGMNCISVSSMYEDFSMMYRDEIIFDTYKTILPDIIISKEAKPYRNTITYYNEYLIKDEIPRELFNSIDLRILKIENYDFYDKNSNDNKYKTKLMVEYYNCLKDIVLCMKKHNLNIPIRETSEVNNVKDEEDNKVICLSKKKILTLPDIVLK